MYDKSLKYKWDNENVRAYAINGAVTEAVNKARAKEALEQKQAIAREMKKEGFPSVQIAKFTKLSIEEIEKL